MARKPKAARTAELPTTVAEPVLPALAAAPAPARRGRPRKMPQAAPLPTLKGKGAASMDTAHKDVVNGSEIHASSSSDQHAAEVEQAVEAKPAAVAPDAIAPDPIKTSKPAAQWDPTTGSAHFNWSEIERTASQQGPNQVMAKLLIAARAEGANSRWPL